MLLAELGRRWTTYQKVQGSSLCPHPPHHDVDNDLNYDSIGQTYDIAVCRTVMVSPELTYDIID